MKYWKVQYAVSKHLYYYFFIGISNLWMLSISQPLQGNKQATALFLQFSTVRKLKFLSVPKVHMTVGKKLNYTERMSRARVGNFFITLIIL